MKNPVAGLASGLLLASCATTMEPASAAWRGDVQRWGTLREALRDGRDQARVAVAEVAREGVYAIGALEGLRGEITIADGEVWISEGHPERPVTTRGFTTNASATVLFAAEVHAWREIVVEKDVDPSELDAYVAGQARAVGLDASRPFPFVVEGGLRHLDMHVLAGECPIRARMLGQEMASPAYQFHSAFVEGRLVGMYAADSSGILCHMGSSTHVHALLDRDGGLTGHAETVGLAAGAVLELPDG
jgi:alpha-acetolactate decarboxylase